MDTGHIPEITERRLQLQKKILTYCPELIVKSIGLFVRVAPLHFRIKIPPLLPAAEQSDRPDALPINPLKQNSFLRKMLRISLSSESA